MSFPHGGSFTKPAVEGRPPVFPFHPASLSCASKADRSLPAESSGSSMKPCNDHGLVVHAEQHAGSLSTQQAAYFLKRFAHRPISQENSTSLMSSPITFRSSGSRPFSHSHVSTDDQDTAAQAAVLKAAGCKPISGFHSRPAEIAGSKVKEDRPIGPGCVPGAVLAERHVALHQAGFDRRKLARAEIFLPQ